MGGGQCNDALVRTGCGHLIQFPAVNGDNHGTGFLCLGGQTLQTPVGIAGGHKYLVDGAAGFQCFGQSVSAFQLAFYFFDDSTFGEAVSAAGCTIPAGAIVPALRTAFVVHSLSPVHFT
jgi:hypothetical protein